MEDRGDVVSGAAVGVLKFTQEFGWSATSDAVILLDVPSYLQTTWWQKR